MSAYDEQSIEILGTLDPPRWRWMTRGEVIERAKADGYMTEPPGANEADRYEPQPLTIVFDLEDGGSASIEVWEPK